MKGSYRKMGCDLPGQIYSVLPLSHVRAQGPWLTIAPRGGAVVRLDVRCLDHVVVGERGIELEAEGVVISLHLADDDEAIRNVANRLAPYTRTACIRTSEVYEDAKRLLEEHERCEAVGTSTPSRPPELLVETEVVSVIGEHLVVGESVAFLITEVNEYAIHGANLPLPGGRLLQAALARLVVVTAGRKTSETRAVLSRRIAAYEANALDATNSRSRDEPER
ncbi:MAG: hypothetical protein H0T46_32670 [Deltaproteobacteria bacterium]|nr:hypothetical protein [Deltaproteobacteria bacterium]